MNIPQHTPVVTRLPALWFGLLGGAMAWTAHLLLAYLIAEFACESGMDKWEFLGVMAPAWWLLIMSMVMLAIASAATCVAYRARKHLHQHDRQYAARNMQQSELQTHNDATQYMARAGYITSGLFMFIILVETIPTFFYLRGC